MKAVSKITNFGLIKGNSYRVKHIGTRWYSVRVDKGFWKTVAVKWFEPPTKEYYEKEK